MKRHNTKKAVAGMLTGVIAMTGVIGSAADMTVGPGGGSPKTVERTDDEKMRLIGLTKEERKEYIDTLINRLPHTIDGSIRNIPGMPPYVSANAEHGLITIDPGDDFLVYPFEIERVTLKETEGVRMPKSHWAREEALKAVEKGYIKGNENGDLNLDGTLTGAECLTALNRVFIDKGVPEVTKDRAYLAKFFGKEHWGSSAVKSVFSRYAYYSLSSEVKELNFQFDSPMTREDMADILYKTLANEEMKREAGVLIDQPLKDVAFKDAKDISPGKKAGVSFCVRGGILRGDDLGNMNPKKPISRAEFMVFLGRIADALEK